MTIIPARPCSPTQKRGISHEDLISQTSTKISQLKSKIDLCTNSILSFENQSENLRKHHDSLSHQFFKSRTTSSEIKELEDRISFNEEKQVSLSRKKNDFEESLSTHTDFLRTLEETEKLTQDVKRTLEEKQKLVQDVKRLKQEIKDLDKALELKTFQNLELASQLSNTAKNEKIVAKQQDLIKEQNSIASSSLHKESMNNET